MILQDDMDIIYIVRVISFFLALYVLIFKFRLITARDVRQRNFSFSVMIVIMLGICITGAVEWVFVRCCR